MNLSFQLDSLKATRDNARKILSAFSLEEINKIPEGFNNNLVWNYGHMIITQQLLCYKLAGAPMHIDKALVKKYAKGTQPEGPVTNEEYQMLLEMDTQTIKHLEADYGSNIFDNYKPYETSYGITLSHIDEAITFNNMHEAHHFGNLLSMRKLLR